MLKHPRKQFSVNTMAEKVFYEREQAKRVDAINSFLVNLICFVTGVCAALAFTKYHPIW